MKKSMIAAMCFILAVIFVSWSSSSQAQDNQGKALVLERCAKCHGIKKVQASVGKFDAGEWTKVVNRMVSKGAVLSNEEKEVLIQFLAAQTSPDALNP